MSPTLLAFVVGIPAGRQVGVIPKGLEVPETETTFVLLVSDFGIGWLSSTSHPGTMYGIVPRPLQFLIDAEVAGGEVRCNDTVQTLLKLRDLPLPYVIPEETGDFTVPTRHGLFVGDAPFSICDKHVIIESEQRGDYEHHIAWDTHRQVSLAAVNFDNRRIVYVPTNGAVNAATEAATDGAATAAR